MSRLYDIINAMVLKKNSVSYQMPTFAQGASGYLTVPHSFGITGIASKTISIRISSGSVTNMRGLQLYPAAISDTAIYIQYYAPQAIPTQLSITVLVVTTE